MGDLAGVNEERNIKIKVGLYLIVCGMRDRNWKYMVVSLYGRTGGLFAMFYILFLIPVVAVGILVCIIGLQKGLERITKVMIPAIVVMSVLQEIPCHAKVLKKPSLYKKNRNSPNICQINFCQCTTIR